MEESFETFDECGQPTGVYTRFEVHRRGLWHRAANVFLFLPDGKLLIQRRQLSKAVWPGAWDLSAAEHLHPGESYEDGALRGLGEELGVAGATLQALGGVAKSMLEVAEHGIKDYEFQQSFRTAYSGPIIPDRREVRATYAIDLRDLEAAFQRRPEEFTPWFRQRAADLGLFRHAHP
jgi:isopentenyl-diphosphate delta-isomerase